MVGKGGAESRALPWWSGAQRTWSGVAPFLLGAADFWVAGGRAGVGTGGHALATSPGQARQGFVRQRWMLKLGGVMLLRASAFAPGSRRDFRWSAGSPDRSAGRFFIPAPLTYVARPI